VGEEGTDACKLLSRGYVDVAAKMQKAGRWKTPVVGLIS
jgi:hypothetical protein